jgi:hypothetical protein
MLLMLVLRLALFTTVVGQSDENVLLQMKAAIFENIDTEDVNPLIEVTGDPHMRNLKGELFDLSKEGEHILIQIPAGTGEQLEVIASVTAFHKDRKCPKFFMTQLKMKGSMVGEEVIQIVSDQDNFGVRLGSATEFLNIDPTSSTTAGLAQVQRCNEDNVLCRSTSPARRTPNYANKLLVQLPSSITLVASNYASANPSFMNLAVSGLVAHGEVGGLLGGDDHSMVAGEPECDTSSGVQRVSMLQRASSTDVGHVGEVSEDVNPLVEVTGDPHMRNLKGELFDLSREGEHVLIQIPAGSGEQLEVIGTVAAFHKDRKCPKFFMTQLKMKGSMVGDEVLQIVSGPDNFGVRLGLSPEFLNIDSTISTAAGIAKVQRCNEDNVLCRSTNPERRTPNYANKLLVQLPSITLVASNYASANPSFMNLAVSGLAAQDDVGGLLGHDDHAMVAGEPECGTSTGVQRVSMLQQASSRRVGHLAEVLEVDPLVEVTGDPHMRNLKGELFDLSREGEHILIQIPAGSGEDLEVIGTVAAFHKDRKCPKFFMTQLKIKGSMVGEEALQILSDPDNFGVKLGSATEFLNIDATGSTAAGTAQVQRCSEDNLLCRSTIPGRRTPNYANKLVVQLPSAITLVASNYASANPSFMNLAVSGLAALDDVGGLLGHDDHSMVAGEPECDPSSGVERVSMLQRVSSTPVGHLGEVWEDAIPLVEVTGDPHMRNLNGDLFDLSREGEHVLIQIPAGSGEDLEVTGTVTAFHKDRKCPKFFMTQLKMKGSMIGEEALQILSDLDNFGVKLGSATEFLNIDSTVSTAAGVTQVQRCNDDNLLCKSTSPGRRTPNYANKLLVKLPSGITIVASNYASANPSFMNLAVSGLAAHDDVGGLLGHDDHAMVTGEPECETSTIQRISMLQRLAPVGHLGEVWEDVNPLVEVTGDPHMRNLKGELFDLSREGEHVLIQIPAGSGEKLEVTGTVSAFHKDRKCPKFFMTRLTMKGSMVGEESLQILSDADNFGVKLGSATEFLKIDSMSSSTGLAQVQRCNEENPLCESTNPGRRTPNYANKLLVQLPSAITLVASNYASANPSFMNLAVSGLAAQDDVGGLLGHDDHSMVASEPECATSSEKISMLQREHSPTIGHLTL